MPVSTLKNLPLLGNLQTKQGFVSSVPANVETDLVSLVVPGGSSFVAQGGSATGMTSAIFRFYIDGILKEVMHNAWTDRNVYFGTMEKVPELKIIKITVEHFSIVAHDFNGSLFGGIL